MRIREPRQTAADQAPLVAALRDPAFYPHRADAVELVETHISWVFLAGDRAYKLKKAIRLPFLDYATAPRRRLMCEEEGRLNRLCSFAPPVVMSGSAGPAATERRPEGAAEWAPGGGGVRGPSEGVGGGGMTHQPAGRSVPSQGSVSRRRPRMPP